jgi:hypothetical protein
VGAKAFIFKPMDGNHQEFYSAAFGTLEDGIAKD